MLCDQLITQFYPIPNVIVDNGNHEIAGFRVGRVRGQGGYLQFKVPDGVAHGNRQGTGLHEERDQGT